MANLPIYWAPRNYYFFQSYGCLSLHSLHITKLFWWDYIFTWCFCVHYTIMMFPSSFCPPEQLVPGVGTNVTNNEHTCGKHCYGCSNPLLLARTSCSSGVLFCLLGTAPDKLTTCVVLCEERAHLKF